MPATPPASRVSPVIDIVHGQSIADPYRWLEQADSAETGEWIFQQNLHTRSLLDAIPGRDAMQRRLSELLSIGTVSAPTVRGERLFFTRRDHGQNQPVLLLREGASERLILDPSTASSEGTVALDWWYPSHDGRLVAYGYSDNGDEWSTLHVLDVDSGSLLPDRIPRTRYAYVAWLPDASGFYYTRYPNPGETPSGEENYHREAFFHQLGDDPAVDQYVLGADLPPEHVVWMQLSSDGRWLNASVSTGPGSSNFYLRDRSESGSEFVPVAVGLDARFAVEIADGMLYILTNLDAPHYRLFRASAEQPGRENWEEIIPESPDAVLESVRLAGGQIVTTYLRNATSALAIFGVDGGNRREVELPLGTVTAVTGEWENSQAFYGFESFTKPPTVYHLSLNDASSIVWATVDASLQPDEFSVAQEWYTSRDGTPISMFIVHRRDLDRSRPRPTVLTGYGGFNHSRTPVFERSTYLWLESGGVYAVPNLRGGGEYGEEWHRAGRLEHKQNVFDDFIAAAEHLIAQGYTEPAQLGISGRSNGGLLVGAALTQRPELFRAVVCGVPLLDMVRYHLFLIARLWIPEYGSAEDPDQFRYLHAYSPYHHVTNGTPYPAVLLFTAESDSRVDPLHARKMTALLQAATASDHPILLRVETRAGHGIGKPLTKIIAEQVDVWAFLLWQLGISP